MAVAAAPTEQVSYEHTQGEDNYDQNASFGALGFCDISNWLFRPPLASGVNGSLTIQKSSSPHVQNHNVV